MDLQEDVTVSAPVETPQPAAPAETNTDVAPAAKADESKADRVEREEGELNAALAKVYRKANAPRDDGGRFAAKDPKPAPAIEGELSAADKPVDAKPEVQAKPAIPPPQQWSAEAKEKWANVPPDVQEIIAKREAESHKAISDLGQKASAFDTLHEVITPHMERIRAEGQRPHEYINNLFAADAALAQDPLGFIRYVAQAKGIDLAQLAPDPFAVQDPQAAQVEQHTRALQAEIANLKRQLGAVSERVIGRETAEQQAQLESLEQMITSFAADKPDWQSLSQEDLAMSMATVRKNNPTLSHKEILEQAYERARWANPTTRDALIKAREADAEKKRLEAAKAAAAQAKRAGGINVTGTVPVRGQVDLDDSLRGIWRKNHAN